MKIHNTKTIAFTLLQSHFYYNCARFCLPLHDMFVVLYIKPLKMSPSVACTLYRIFLIFRHHIYIFFHYWSPNIVCYNLSVIFILGISAVLGLNTRWSNNKVVYVAEQQVITIRCVDQEGSSLVNKLRKLVC